MGGPEFLVADELGRAVDVQPDVVPGEVHEEQADVRVLGDVAGTGHDAVPAVLGVGQGAVVQDGHEPRRPGAEGGVALPAGVGGGEEDHGLAADEVTHVRGEVGTYLPVVERVGAFHGAEVVLQHALSLRGGRVVRGHSWSISWSGRGGVRGAVRTGVSSGSWWM